MIPEDYGGNTCLHIQESFFDQYVYITYIIKKRNLNS